MQAKCGCVQQVNTATYKRCVLLGCVFTPMALCCRLQKMYPREMGHNHRFALKRAERRQISKSLGDKAAERNRQNQNRRMSRVVGLGMTHSHDSVTSMVDSTDSESGGYWAGKPIAPAKSPVKSPRPEPAPQT